MNLNDLLIRDLETTLSQLDQFKGRTLYIGDYETDSHLGLPMGISDDIIPLIKGVIRYKLNEVTRDKKNKLG